MDTRADDLTRLRGEITELHGSLEAFVNDVRDREAQRQKQAKKDKAERVGNDAQRVHQAEEDLSERAEFVSGIRKEVARLRKGFAAENAAAHKAWFGSRRATTAAGGRAAGRRSKAKAGAGTR